MHSVSPNFPWIILLLIFEQLSFKDNRNLDGKKLKNLGNLFLGRTFACITPDTFDTFIDSLEQAHEVPRGINKKASDKIYFQKLFVRRNSLCMVLFANFDLEGLIRFSEAFLLIVVKFRTTLKSIHNLR